MSHARQPCFLATADALLATSWRRHTRQDVTQKASRRSLAAESILISDSEIDYPSSPRLMHPFLCPPTLPPGRPLTLRY